MPLGVAFSALVLVLSALLSVQRSAPPAPGGLRTVTDVRCAADLGVGVKSGRRFCDVLVGTTPAESVALTIPPHTGTATLRFDLHNRFDVPAAGVPAGLAFARHQALVAVIRPTGELIGRSVVAGDFRTVDNLFDQITGAPGRTGAVKLVAPGPAEAISLTVPAGVSSLGIVGTRLTVVRRAGEETYETPGRPVALVSRVTVEYRPR